MYHILVIDDEKAILDVIKIVLSRAGFKVEIALDGIEGIQKFNSGQFDLAICQGSCRMNVNFFFSTLGPLHAAIWTTSLLLPFGGFNQT